MFIHTHNLAQATGDQHSQSENAPKATKSIGFFCSWSIATCCRVLVNNLLSRRHYDERRGENVKNRFDIGNPIVVSMNRQPLNKTAQQVLS